MLTAQEIANYLQTKLDEIGATRPEMYEFSILSEIAKDYDGNKINGMVKTVSPELAPFPEGYVEAKYVFVVQMFVSGSTNRRYLNVNSIIDELIKNNQCSSVAFENGKGIVTFTMGVPEGYKIEYDVGEGVPLTFTVRVTYTENAVTSADKHWLLDGVEIPFLSESVSVEREGISRKIYTEVYSKILLTGQTKFYSFRIPYESETFKSLQSEILQSPAVNAIVHTLTYYDGKTFMQDNPFTAKVSIYRSANSKSTRPNASEYEVTFTDVDNPNKRLLKYYISLIDFPFDMQGDDTRYFNSTAEQIEYFETKSMRSGAPFIEIEAPNLDGLVITKQVYRVPNPYLSESSQFNLVSKNYAVIKVVRPRGALYFYYFIENATIGADGCILVDLKMDTVQTYFFDENISFSDCLIERAHLNRFEPVDGDSTKVKFVTDPASRIYNAEAGLNFPKRLVQREKLKLRFTDNLAVDEWLKRFVDYWVYIFIDPSHEYTVNEIGGDSTKIKPDATDAKIKYASGMVGATSCICYPIYKNKNAEEIQCHIAVKDTNGNITKYDDVYLGESGRLSFETSNPDEPKTPYYYNIKISIIPPFTWNDNMGWSIDPLTGNLVVKCNGERKYALFGGVGRSKIIKTGASNGLFIGSIQGNFVEADYVIKENRPINKNTITQQQPPNPAFNPKLNGQNFKELVVTASSGDSFTYDIQKLNDSSVVFEYSEPIVPEITKYYLRVKGGTGLFAEGTDENYTGLVGSTDNGIAYVNDQYAAYIANNKNFYLQSNIKIATGVVTSTVSGAKSGAEAGPMGVLIGAATGLTEGVYQAGLSAIDRGLTVDNMRNAPDQLKNANGNVIFNMFCTDLGLYVEKCEALEGDLKTANDFMNLYGFSFNAVANVRDYAHIRKYHNYVKAQLQSINGNVNNVARADLRQRFAKGVRFWNNDAIEYRYENYELWLEK